MNLKKPWLLLKTEFQKLRDLKTEITEEKAKSFIEISADKRSDFRVVGKKAIIEIKGILTRTENIFTMLFGGTSIDKILAQLNEAANNEKIKAIILDINSPGGEVDGVPELAEQIRNIRSKKPVISYVNYIGASGAYWIATAASEIIIQEAASVGSIGVYAEFDGGRDEDDQTVQVVSSQSPKKIADVTTSAGLIQVQKHIDKLAEIFIENVAKNRSVSIEKVKADFGQGDILTGIDAVNAGMADQVGNFNTAFEKANILLKKDIDKIKANNNVNNILKNSTNKKRGFIMSDQEKFLAVGNSQDIPEGLPIANIDKEFLIKNFSGLVEEMKAAGAAEENKRIVAINSILTNTDQEKELKQAAIADPKINAEKFSFQLVTSRQEAIEKIKAARKEDAEKILSIDSENDDSASAEEEEKKVVELMKSGIKKAQNIK